MPNQWLPIDDFSPGIYSAPGNGFAGGLQAPQGSAQMADTFGCAPGAGGRGLVPLPGQPTVKNLDLGLPATAPNAAPYVIGQEIVDGAYEYVALWYTSAGGPPTVNNMVIIGSPSDAANDWQVQAAQVAATGMTPTTITFTQSRMSPTTPYTTPGEPIVAYGGFFSNGVNGFTPRVTPNPTAPGNNTLDLGAAIAAWTFGHQNRVIIFERTAYTRVTARGEQISFTDPANSNVLPGTLQRQVFYPEHASGYGAWGSLTASQLLLIKRTGGGCLVEGDIAAPRITYLPGVTSTGSIVTKMYPTSIGLVYASDANGLWVWNGSASSKKLSRQLVDNFWYHGSVASGAFSSLESGPRIQTQQWGDYIVVTGAWLFHIPTGGWWRLFNPSGAIEPFMFAEQITSQSLRACRVRLATSSGSAVAYADEYASTTLTNSWSWHSHPIKLTNDTDVALNEIVLDAQRDTSGTGTSTITITVYNADGTSATLPAWTVTSSARPERIRIPCLSLGNFAEVKLVAANSSTAPAPIVLSMALGWSPSNLAPVG